MKRAYAKQPLLCGLLFMMPRATSGAVLSTFSSIVHKKNNFRTVCEIYLTVSNLTDNWQIMISLKVF